MNTQIVNEVPNALEKLGENVFLPYAINLNQIFNNVVYINKDLYEKKFKKSFDYKVACGDIKNLLIGSLDIENLDEMQAYIDKQKDPTDIALNGNLGSGRAVYFNKTFNIKGIKTPFATSSRKDYNHGKLSLDCAIQECVISNVLNKINGFTNFETLAVIETNEFYEFVSGNGKKECGLIVRNYEDNELYRFTHRFVNKVPFKKAELISISSNIGEMEGLKFIERFLHGAWSLGNLSIDSNMIDLDTSYFVSGRHPQWSFTNRYKTNFFGNEHLGHIKMLDIIVESDLNIEKTKIEELSKIIKDQRMKTIKKEFCRLCGYSEQIYLKYKVEFDSLSEKFYYLSQFIYDNYDNLNCSDANCDNSNLFDFSKFLRYYEINLLNGKNQILNLLELLINSNAHKVEYTYDDEEYRGDIIDFFEKNIVKNDADYARAIKEAILFIKEFLIIDNTIKLEENIDINEKIIKAYLENENKKYLTAKYWMRGELVLYYKKFGSQRVNDLINFIINYSNNKYSLEDNLLSDFILFEEAILYKLISKKGFFKYVLELYENILVTNIVLILNGEEIEFSESENKIYESKAFDLKRLEETKNIFYNCLNIKLTAIGNKVDFQLLSNKKTEKIK